MRQRRPGAGITALHHLADEVPSGECADSSFQFVSPLSKQREWLKILDHNLLLYFFVSAEVIFLIFFLKHVTYLKDNHPWETHGPVWAAKVSLGTWQRVSWLEFLLFLRQSVGKEGQEDVAKSRGTVELGKPRVKCHVFHSLVGDLWNWAYIVNSIILFPNVLLSSVLLCAKSSAGFWRMANKYTYSHQDKISESRVQW